MSTSKSATAHPFLVITITTLLSLAPSSASTQYQIHGINKLGFSANLIHRDSPPSPFYNHNLTQSDRIKASVQRSHSRQRYLQSLSNRKITPNEPQPQVTPDYDIGEYVMNYSIGTPPVPTYAIVDTASEIIWLQCLPCQQCDPQKLPIFDPSQSSTYEMLGCEDYKCSLSFSTMCNQTTHTCAYSLEYTDGSYTKGDLSLETLTFSDDVSIGQIPLSNMVIGCGHTNLQEPLELGAINPPGTIGLNQKTLSFIKQLSIEQFSYCLVETKSNFSSRMHFQSKAVLFGGKTPILNGKGMDDAYYLYLEGISVGSTRLPTPEGSFNMTSTGDGGFMIDSGTSYTILKPDANDMLIKEMVKQINNKVPGTDPSWEGFAPCYNTTLDVIKSVAPDLTFHLGGLDLVLNKVGTWIDAGQGKVCLATLPSFSALSIFGNFQQQNMNVGFDLKNKVVSFMNMEDCNTI